ncbi:MAG: hypothetical protein ACW98F_18255 [Candidatus Hodarchaeales archaeon]
MKSLNSNKWKRVIFTLDVLILIFNTLAAISDDVRVKLLAFCFGSWLLGAISQYRLNNDRFSLFRCEGTCSS